MNYDFKSVNQLEVVNTISIQLISIRTLKDIEFDGL